MAAVQLMGLEEPVVLIKPVGHQEPFAAVAPKEPVGLERLGKTNTCWWAQFLQYLGGNTRKEAAREQRR